MPLEQTVLCDQCSKDISTTLHQIDWRLTLSPECMPQAVSGDLDQTVVPQIIPQTLYLCSLACVQAKATALIAAQGS